MQCCLKVKETDSEETHTTVGHLRYITNRFTVTLTDNISDLVQSNIPSTQDLDSRRKSWSSGFVATLLRLCSSLGQPEIDKKPNWVQESVLFPSNKAISLFVFTASVKLERSGNSDYT